MQIKKSLTEISMFFENFGTFNDLKILVFRKKFIYIEFFITKKKIQKIHFCKRSERAFNLLHDCYIFIGFNEVGIKLQIVEFELYFNSINNIFKQQQTLIG